MSGKIPHMQKCLTALLMIASFLLAGCDEQPPEQSPSQICSEIYDELRVTGKLSDAQMELLVLNREHVYWWSEFNDLMSITDAQAESLSELPDISLGGLASITDAQAESLGQVGSLSLNGLTSMTDAQAEGLGQVVSWLSLDGLTSITDAQAESLGPAGLLTP